jgi:hypothetical protein
MFVGIKKHFILQYLVVASRVGGMHEGSVVITHYALDGVGLFCLNLMSGSVLELWPVFGNLNAPLIYTLKNPFSSGNCKRQLAVIFFFLFCQSQTTDIRKDKKSDSEPCYNPVFLCWQVSSVPGELPAPGSEGVPPRGIHPLQDARQFSPQHSPRI